MPQTLAEIRYLELVIDSLIRDIQYVPDSMANHLKSLYAQYKAELN